MKLFVNTYRYTQPIDAAPGVEAGGMLTQAVNVSHNMPPVPAYNIIIIYQVTYDLFCMDIHVLK